MKEVGDENVFIAHVRKDEESFKIQTLQEHLTGTSVFSESFASVFGASGWGKQAGLWHDLGKYTTEDFQPYIRNASGMTGESKKPMNKPDHSTAGAIWAKMKLPHCYPPLSYCIAGHHSGLLDWVSGGDANMSRRYQKESCCGEMRKDAPVEVLEELLPLEAPALSDPEKEFHLWIRMLFSCLVDADYLDTEQFMMPDQAERRGKYDSLQELKICFDKYMEELSVNAPSSFINEKRASILSRCREKAKDIPGFFSLTVPTGGGKTLASMAWALDHAVR